MEARRRPSGWPAVAVFAALASVPVAAPPVAAQQRAPDVERRDCQCVDGQGREIERCMCIVTPDGWAVGPGGPGLWEIPLGPMGMARRAVLGVGISTDQLDEIDAQGARVGTVEPESGADEAGLEEGDVIVALDGRSLLDPLEDADAEAGIDEDESVPVQRLLALLADREPGDRVEIAYLRDGERRSTTVELEAPRRFVGGRGIGIGAGPFAAPAPPAGVRAPLMTLWNGPADCPTPAAGAAPMLEWGRSCAGGAALIELSAGLAEYFQAEAGDVLVTDVAADNPLGLAAGDVLVAVGGREVRGLEHALGMLRSYQDDEQVQVRVLRKGQTLELDGTLR